MATTWSWKTVPGAIDYKQPTVRFKPPDRLAYTQLHSKRPLQLPPQLRSPDWAPSQLLGGSGLSRTPARPPRAVAACRCWGGAGFAQMHARSPPPNGPGGQRGAAASTAARDWPLTSAQQPAGPVAPVSAGAHQPRKVPAGF
jgi:hypothetical protein